MAFLSWRREYEVGVWQIDAEHRSLFKLVNEFHDTHARGHSRKEIARVLNRLVAYAEEHFQHEERLMSENDYPLLDQHREQHGALVSSIFAIEERLAHDIAGAGAEILQFIRKWLVEHIIRNDMHIGDYLQRRTLQAGKAPMDANAKKIEDTAPAGAANSGG